MRNTNSEFEWTDDTIRELRQIWSEGHSTAEIGRRMGVTKNTVVGQAHRLDLPARPSPMISPRWRATASTRPNSQICRRPAPRALRPPASFPSNLPPRPMRSSLPHRRPKHMASSIV